MLASVFFIYKHDIILICIKIVYTVYTYKIFSHFILHSPNILCCYFMLFIYINRTKYGRFKEYENYSQTIYPIIRITFYVNL